MRSVFCLRNTLLLTSALALAGCVALPGAQASRSALSSPGLTQAEASDSATISGLLARKSALAPSSPYAEVARVVLAANSRPQEAELRAARLRAVAASYNWLPTLGPSISLTSMGDLVADLLVDQVLFDNGGKKAERVFAAADVEVAATTLAQDTNDRVAQALGFYIRAEQARTEAALVRTALGRAQRFEGIMERRVAGGVSDRTDLSVVRAKRAELESDLETLRQDEATALAELTAMSAEAVTGLRGLGALTSLDASGTQSVETLAFARAEAEGRRDVAQAQVARAGLLPGVSANATLGDNGSDGIGLSSAATGLGLGTPAQIEALEATREASSRALARTREDAARELASLSARRDALAAQAAEARQLADEAEDIFRQTERQYEAGFRTILDVVGTFEKALRFQRDAVRLTHQRAEANVRIAQRLGRLVDGERI